jgi:histidyl-tRNA synthetase
VIVVGADEVARGVVTARDMASGVESDVLLNDLLDGSETES